MSDEQQPGQRLDKWLWCARFFKSRNLAGKECRAGHVTLNGRTVDKPHRPVRPGDHLAFRDGRYVRRLRVLALGERRGPAPEARTLFEETAEPEPIDRLERDVPKRPRGAGKPTRGQRRELERLKGKW